MAKRKKKWHRGTRNPGLTIVFSDRTREAIESMAADGSAKSAVVARLVETALGLANANVPTSVVSSKSDGVGAITINGVVRDDLDIEIEMPDGRIWRGVPKSRGLVPASGEILHGIPKSRTEPLSAIEEDDAPPQPPAATSSAQAVQVAPTAAAAVAEEPAEPGVSRAPSPQPTPAPLAPVTSSAAAAVDPEEPADLGDARPARGLLGGQS